MLEKFYYFQNKHRAQVHAEKTRRAGIEVTQIYTKKPEMPPVTFAGSLCKIHAICVRKLQIFME